MKGHYIKKLCIAFILFFVCVSCKNDRLAEKRERYQQQRQERVEERRVSYELQEKLREEDAERKVVRKKRYKEYKAEQQTIEEGREVIDAKLVSVTPLSSDAIFLTFDNGLVVCRTVYNDAIWRIGQTYKLFLELNDNKRYPQGLTRIEVKHESLINKYWKGLIEKDGKEKNNEDDNSKNL